MPSSKKTIATIPLSKVRGSDYNPVSRITNTRIMNKTRDSIAKHGQLSPIHVVAYPDGTFRIADGHRRVNAMLELGMTEVEAIIHRPVSGENTKEVVDLLFTELNNSTKAFNGRDKLNVALQGGPVFDPSIKSAKTQLELLFEQAEIEMLINKEITTTAFNLAKRTTKYVLDGSGIGENTPTHVARVKNHIRYVLRNDVQQPLTVYMRLGYDKKALKTAIDNNRPPPRVSSDRLIESWKK